MLEDSQAQGKVVDQISQLQFGLDMSRREGMN